MHVTVYMNVNNVPGQLGGELGLPSRSQYEGYVELPQVKAALDTIAWAEGGQYNNKFGGSTFSGSQHPNDCIPYKNTCSTAAGRYQFLHSTWTEIKNRLGLPDFTARYQDIAAVDLIAQRGQLQKLLDGDFEGVMKGLGCAWAALPYATCGQTRRPLEQTMNYYRSALAVYGGKAPTNNLPSGSSPFSAIAAGGTMTALAGVLILALLID